MPAPSSQRTDARHRHPRMKKSASVVAIVSFGQSAQRCAHSYQIPALETESMRTPSAQVQPCCAVASLVASGELGSGKRGIASIKASIERYRYRIPLRGRYRFRISLLRPFGWAQSPRGRKNKVSVWQYLVYFGIKIQSWNCISPPAGRFQQGRA